ncbi:MAG: permease [Parachlamydiales bacterium]|nr:permease [Parachlamydiales bacterium]
MQKIFYLLEVFAKWLTYQVFSIRQSSYLGNSVEFFIYDILKIFILLFILIFFIALFRSYISKESIQKVLSHKKQYLGYFSAALIGIIMPFCSCSAIPLFLTLLEAGVPTGITFTFLIASPIINEVALIMLFSLFGIKIALIYVISGLLISIVSGIILGKMKVDRFILNDILIKNFSSNKTTCACQKNLRNKIINAKNYAFSILKKIWIYVIFGVGIGAWIHGYIPNDFLIKHARLDKWYDVPLAVLIGIPLYSNAAGVIPLISSLVEKGLSMGTALALMMAVTGLSLPEFIILKRIMRWKLLFIYASIVGIGIILIGYVFNMVL